MNGLKLRNSKPSWDIPFYKGGKIIGETTPALPGVGFIIGTGAVAFGGPVTLVPAIPAIPDTYKTGLRSISNKSRREACHVA